VIDLGSRNGDRTVPRRLIAANELKACFGSIKKFFGLFWEGGYYALQSLTRFRVSLRFRSFVSLLCGLHRRIVFYLLFKVWSGDDFVEAFVRFVTHEIAVPFQKGSAGMATVEANGTKFF
jgi:hypothetical protein